jgi:hypothetical protein
MQANRVAQTLGCIQRLVCGLAIDQQDSGKAENKIGTFLQRHICPSHAMLSKAATAF